MRNDLDRESRKNSSFLLYGAVATLAAVLLVYSETKAFTWDEGFHLLAAQLIKHGQQPYLDFCFPQTPLNAYWNAGWMRIFGENWRIAHAVAALLTSGAILITADFVRFHFRLSRWPLTAALTAAVMMGLNSVVVEFGTIGQAYGLCLFLSVASFRLAVLAIDRKGTGPAAAAGLLASAAAGSSLLTAPVAPVLFSWIVICSGIGSRWRKGVAFVAAAAVPLLPILWLFAKAPQQVFFNLAGYHLFYRSVEWEGATRHDLEVLISWIDSPQALLLGLLALAGLIFTMTNIGAEDRSWRRKMYLCFWLTIALALNSAIAHPTFARYFVLMVPFLSILASVGLCEIFARLNVEHRMWPVWGLTILLALGLGKALYDRREVYSWLDLEQLARKVDEVTPPHAVLLAEEPVYFLTRRTPPEGMEFTEAQKLNLSPAMGASLHILSRAQLAEQVRSGMFDTVQTCSGDDDQRFTALGVAPMYRQKIVIEGCTIFWDKQSGP